METRTEEAAKRLICPLLTTPGALMKCQGCACMAWTWDNDGFQYDWGKATRWFKADEPGTVREGLANGWVYHREDHPSIPGYWRDIPRRPLPLGRTGYCGALTAKVAEVEVNS